MSSLQNPATGAPVVDVVKILADPRWAADVPASAANPMQSRVGWFNLNNISCGLLGMPFGFLIMWVVSLLGQAPSKEMQAFVDEIRRPRGRTVIQEKD
jgi:cation/acetate symporter